jgi:predicted kinase
MDRLLLITGDLATGKSTFSHLLSDRYGAAVFNKDTIKETLSDEIGFKDRAENKKLSVAAVKVMEKCFEGIIPTRADAIMEANFHEGEMDIFHKLADENGYRTLTLVLQGDIKVLHERFLHRMRFEHRNKAHLSVGADDYEVFRDYVLKSRDVRPVGESILIDATDFSYQTDKAILDKIDDFFGR